MSHLIINQKNSMLSNEILEMKTLRKPMFGNYKTWTLKYLFDNHASLRVNSLKNTWKKNLSGKKLELLK